MMTQAWMMVGETALLAGLVGFAVALMISLLAKAIRRTGAGTAAGKSCAGGEPAAPASAPGSDSDPDPEALAALVIAVALRKKGVPRS